MAHNLILWECDHISESWTWQDNKYEDWKFTHNTDYPDIEVCDPDKYEIPIEDIRENIIMQDYEY